jgi:hypothetical protein
MELTFEVLCELEPQLKSLYDEFRNRPRERWHRVVSVWSQSDYKKRMKHLVGWFRISPEGGPPFARREPTTSLTTL